MNRASEIILRTKKSKSYIDYWKYHRDNIFGITKKSRDEHLHSNFIAWVLDPNSDLVPNFFCLNNFLSMLCLDLIKDKPENAKSRVIDPVLEANILNGGFIISADIQREKENIDLLLEITTKDKILPVVIENKVKSSENGGGKQTDKYFNWAENEYADNQKYYKPIYVWLRPRFNNHRPHKEEFLSVEYQDLVDYVIEPARNASSSPVVMNNISIYLQCLSFQTDNTKGDKIMAISSEERERLERFKKENKELVDLLVEDLDVSDDVKDQVRSGMDTTEYEFNGQKYRKTHLFSELIKYYIKDKNPTSFAEIEMVFGKVGKKKNLVREMANITDKRRFDEIQLGNVTFGASNQWSIGDMNDVLSFAKDQLGYTVTPC